MNIVPVLHDWSTVMVIESARNTMARDKHAKLDLDRFLRRLIG